MELRIVSIGGFLKKLDCASIEKVCHNFRRGNPASFMCYDENETSMDFHQTGKRTLWHI